MDTQVAARPGATPPPTVWNRRVPAVMLVGLLLAVLLVPAWLSRQSIYDTVRDRFGPQVDATVTVEELPPGPLAARRDASAVWTGSRMIVWGGYAAGTGFAMKDFADGAAYDPATATWSRIAASPLGGREEHLAVWTGTEMIVWGGVSRGGDGMRSLADGAAYDPKTDRWRRIARAPLPGAGRPTGVMWGRVLAVVVPREEGADFSGPNDSILLYDPVADRWDQAGVGPSPVQVVVYRGALLVLGAPSQGGPWLRVAADPTEPPAEVPFPIDPTRPWALGLAATGRGVALSATGEGGGTELARWTGDPADLQNSVGQWSVRRVPGDRLLPAVDLFSNFPHGAGALDERHLVGTSRNGLWVLDVTTGAVAAPAPEAEPGSGSAPGRYCGSAAAFAWTGAEMLAWGGEDCWDMVGPRTIAAGRSYRVRLG